MAALLAEHRQPHHAHHTIEIAQRNLDLRQQVDCTDSGGGPALINSDLRPSLPLATGTPSARHSWPDTNNKLPVRTKPT